MLIADLPFNETSAELEILQVFSKIKEVTSSYPFQGAEKECIGNEWEKKVNSLSCIRQQNSDMILKNFF